MLTDALQDAQNDINAAPPAAEHSANPPQETTLAREEAKPTINPSSEKGQMRDIVRKSFKELVTESAVRAAKGDKPDATQPADKANAPRAADGKFTKGDTPAKPLTPIMEGNADKPGDGQPLAAPASWGAGAKTLFASLPPDVQREVARLEAERSKAVRAAQDESATTRKRYGELEPAFEAHSQRLALRGETPSQAVRRLLEVEAAFDRDPVGVLRELARQRGIDLAGLGGQQPRQTPGIAREDMDPALAELYDKVGTLTQQQQAEQRARMERVQNEAASTVEDFRAQKDEAGNPKYPHIDKLTNEIAFEVRRLQAADRQTGKAPRAMGDYLREAYEAAVWAHPETRSELLQAQLAARDAERQKQTTEHAQRAVKPAAAAVRGGAGATTTPQTMRDIIRQSWQESRG